MIRERMAAQRQRYEAQVQVYVLAEQQRAAAARSKRKAERSELHASSSVLGPYMHEGKVNLHELVDGVFSLRVSFVDATLALGARGDFECQERFGVLLGEKGQGIP